MRIRMGMMLSLLLGSANLVLATTNAGVRPDTVICEGRYVLGDRDSKNDGVQFALMEAKKLALEQTGTFLRSQAKVENYMLTEQEIETISMGLMTTEILEQRNEPVGETTAIVVKIRAIIHPQDLESSLAELQHDNATTEELSQLKQDYQRLASQMDSLKQKQQKDPTAPVPARRSQIRTKPGRGGKMVLPAERLANREDGWLEMQRIETLMKIITETGKNRPALAKVESLSQTLLEKHPNQGLVYGYLGIAKFKNDQIDAAIADLNRAVKPQPTAMKKKAKSRVNPELLKRVSKEQARFHFYLAQCYQATNQIQLAQQHFKEAKNLDPQNKTYQQPPSESR